MLAMRIQRHHSPVWVRALIGVSAFVLVAIVGCTSPQSPSGELLQVSPPPDLQKLEKGVREQFETVWQNLHRLEGEAHTPEQLGAAWGALGQWLDAYKYSDSAVRCYRNARALDTMEPRWPYYLGRLAEAAGDLEAAGQQYSIAAKLAPGVVEPRVKLGDLALRRQDLDRAEAIYEDILAAHPDSPGALFGRGRVALLHGDAAAAVESLERLAKKQPEAAEVHYSLALAWRKLGDEKRTREQLHLVPAENLDQVPLRLDAPWELELQRLDQGTRTLTRRGWRAFRRHAYGRAAVLLGRAVDGKPEDADMRINYALVLVATRHWAAATEQLDEALRLAGDRKDVVVKAQVELARVSMAQRRLEAAVPHLEAALEVDPESVSAHLEFGRLRQQQGKLEEAVRHYAAVRSSDRPLAGTRFWHAALLLRLGRDKAAAAALDEDLHQLGDDEQLRLLLARVLATAPQAEQRDLPRASQLLAASTGTPDVLYAETAAMVAAAGGKFDQAVTWEQAAVDALATARPRSAAHTARRRLVLYRRRELAGAPWEARETPITVPVSNVPLSKR